MDNFFVFPTSILSVVLTNSTEATGSAEVTSPFLFILYFIPVLPVTIHGELSLFILNLPSSSTNPVKPSFKLSGFTNPSNPLATELTTANFIASSSAPCLSFSLASVAFSIALSFPVICDIVTPANINKTTIVTIKDISVIPLFLIFFNICIPPKYKIIIN